MIPSNPYMLLSYVNMKLRDEYESLDELCSSLDLSKDALTEKLAGIDYHYDSATNQFK